jgi:hypothetical protein
MVNYFRRYNTFKSRRKSNIRNKRKQRRASRRVRGGAAHPRRDYFAFTVIPRAIAELGEGPTLENYGNEYLNFYRRIFTDEVMNHLGFGLRNIQLSIIDINIGIEEEVMAKAILASYIRKPGFNERQIMQLVTIDNESCLRPIYYRDDNEDYCLFAWPVSDEDLERYMRQQRRR